MDPQPYPLLHFLVRMKLTSTNAFLQIAKIVEVTRGKDQGCTEDVEVFLSKISESYLSPDWQYGDGRYHAKGIPGRFDFMAHRNALNHQETNHTSLLFFPCLHFQCWTNTLYTTLTSRAIRKQLCGSVRFHYALLLP